MESSPDDLGATADAEGPNDAESVDESGASDVDETDAEVVNGPENATETGTPDDGVAANEGKTVGGGAPTE